MLSLFLSFLLYILFVFIHAFLHRFLVRAGKKTFASVGVFGIGLIILVGVFLQYGFLPLPWTSIVLYSLLSWLHVILFTSPYYGDPGPSVRIREAIKQREKLTRSELRDLFSDKVLIDNRLHDLVRDGFVYEQKGRLYLTRKGTNLHGFLQVYRTALNWDSSG